MTFRFLLLILLFCPFAYAWIEEVDDCKVCRPIYNSTCRGVGVPSLKTSCATAKETELEYTVGLLHQIFPNLPVNSCDAVITCPLGTSQKIRIGIEEIPSTAVYYWCEETGKNAGKWYTPGYWNKPGNLEITSVACRPIG
ncbi:hypothetical protein CAEBREN_11823 [Caenorhabditis brenneri]|uniref:Uncharacterized protein n=1 Tax=Caenorhabditis brenneri TaxID=135651 RepID=G0MSX0_CAEBE|nr:hypothetical protein CAEBREN_11823 [Caenorhabditis brenneri]